MSLSSVNDLPSVNELVLESIQTKNLSALQKLITQGHNNEKLSTGADKALSACFEHFDTDITNCLLTYKDNSKSVNNVLYQRLKKAIIAQDLEQIEYLSTNKYLPAKHQPIKISQELFHMACQQKDKSVIISILSSEAQTGELNSVYTSQVGVLFRDSVKYDNLTLMLELLKNENLKPYIEKRYGGFNSFIHFALSQEAMSVISALLEPENYKPSGSLHNIPPPDLNSEAAQRKCYGVACTGEGHAAMYLINHNHIQLDADELFVGAVLNNNTNLLNHFLITPKYKDEINYKEIAPKAFIHACQKKFIQTIKFFLHYADFELEKSEDVQEFLQTNEFSGKLEIQSIFEKNVLNKNLNLSAKNLHSPAKNNIHKI